MLYIPNFAETPPPDEHHGPEHGTPLERPVVILFPRRFETDRGIELFAHVAQQIREMGYNAEFHFVGDGSRSQWLREFIERTELKNVSKVYGLHFSRMGYAYGIADIVVVPTLSSEGTSLACIEAMAYGRAVVATNVGGLGNLIIDGYNGLLVEPNEQALLGALLCLLDNPERRDALGLKASEVAKAFSLEIWRERFMHVVNAVVGDRPIHNRQW
jgi:glycosyltransferase involved in cell wall biosynthesis